MSRPVFFCRVHIASNLFSVLSLLPSVTVLRAISPLFLSVIWMSNYEYGNDVRMILTSCRPWQQTVFGNPGDCTRYVPAGVAQSRHAFLEPVTNVEKSRKGRHDVKIILPKRLKHAFVGAKPAGVPTASPMSAK